MSGNGVLGLKVFEPFVKACERITTESTGPRSEGLGLSHASKCKQKCKDCQESRAGLFVYLSPLSFNFCWVSGVSVLSESVSSPFCESDERIRDKRHDSRIRNDPSAAVGQNLQKVGYDPMRKLLADTLYNPNGDQSWEQYQADEEARERFVEYVLDGRL